MALPGIAPSPREEAHARRERETMLATIPDVRDGLTRLDRVILYCLHELEKEARARGLDERRKISTAMIYGRVAERIPIAPKTFEAALARLVERPRGG